MQPDPEERLSEEPGRSPIPWGLIAIVVVLVVAGVWYFAGEQEAPPEPAVAEAPRIAPTAPVEEPQPPAEDIPLAAPPPPPATQEEPAEPPPPPLTLEESDDVLRYELAGVTESEQLAVALEEDHLVERATAMVDALSRGLLVHKTLPLPRPEEKFAVTGEPEALQIDPASYARYDDHAATVAELDVSALVASFHKMRPLLEQVYATLGYPAEEFDNALIRALDRVLATPELESVPAVEPSGGIYKFTDPALEELAPVQKLLLRMGPENAALVKAKAAELRAALLNG